MNARTGTPQYKLWEKLIFFFPVQLVFVHLKKNLILLCLWLLLFAIITKNISLKYGVPYLFLFPEYLGKVNLLSHALVGLCAGAFIMSFNISSYVVNGFRFPFLATLNRPFIKYCQNNFIIPLTFSVVYVVMLVLFQLRQEALPLLSIFWNVVGFMLGNLMFIAITGAYFAATNKNLFHFLPKRPITPKGEYINPVRDLFSNQKKWNRQHTGNRKEWKVVSYISAKGKIALARDSSHYSREMIERVYSQNRINASLFQFSILASLFVIGLFSESKWFMIPAASSVLLFFTMLIMLISACYSWFKGWTSIVMIALLVAINFISTKNTNIYKNQAYGLDYTVERAPYTPAAISEHQFNNQNLYLDVEHGLATLQQWKDKTGEDKPMAVFINVPGGGLRSAMWVCQSLGMANEASDGKLWNNAILISGSSGGMIGAAYLREYVYRTQQGLFAGNLDTIINDIGKDKLNAVAATAVLNDIFFRFKSFEYDGHTYTLDRARAFEEKLNADTRGWLNKPLEAYAKLESEAKMPMLLLAPTISDDGRKLLISSQPIAYLCHNTSEHQLNENLEFRRFFAKQGAERLNFLTALRMSATFPYVFPSANLPTSPEVEVLDAGIRDNFGMSNTLKYIYFFQDWLAKNTSGVLIVQVRDQEKIRENAKTSNPSILEGMTQPFGTFYNTILDVQDYQMDDQIRLARDWYAGEINVVDFVLNRSEANPISLSWHLTRDEADRVQNAINTDYNQHQLARLRQYLSP